jgi:N-acetylglutamate synthase-like GNAT family acetyltransferase
MIMPGNHIAIIPFSPELAPQFAALNIAWLKKYFEIEPIDQEMLNNPQKYFIDKGGYIFFATIDGEIAGTFALLPVCEDVYELSKMAVAEKFQGMDIGNELLKFCIGKANELKAKKIILFSNTKLRTALHLYRKYGFVEVPITNSGYIRSDIQMELEIIKV